MPPRHIQWVIVILGFVVACIFDATCPRHSEAMTMQPTGDDWVVSFMAHPDNEMLMVTVECRKGDALWRQTLVHDQNPDASQFRLRIPKTPADHNCAAIGMIMRNSMHDHQQDHQVIGESVIIILMTKKTTASVLLPH